MISLILQAIRSIMFSNLYRRSQQLELKKKVSLRRRKTYGQSFYQKQSMRKCRAHFIRAKTFFSDFYSTKGSIISLKPKTWKKTHNFWVNTNTCFEEKCLLSETRKNFCTIIPLTVNVTSLVVFCWVFTGPLYCLLASFTIFFEKIGSSLFFFAKEVVFLTQKKFRLKKPF